jgi:Uri superfamily endonuclease
MKSDPGTYVLVLRSELSTPTEIGRWGTLGIRPGYYLYVGSAFGPGGLLARVSRHCRAEKAKRWHIDYLRELTTPTAVWYSYGPDRYEHQWAQALAKMPGKSPIKGFGCSDCKCESHLFFSAKKPALAAFSRAAEGRIASWSCDSAT